MAFFVFNINEELVPLSYIRTSDSPPDLIVKRRFRFWYAMKYSDWTTSRLIDPATDSRIVHLCLTSKKTQGTSLGILTVLFGKTPRYAQQRAPRYKALMLLKNPSSSSYLFLSRHHFHHHHHQSSPKAFSPKSTLPTLQISLSSSRSSFDNPNPPWPPSASLRSLACVPSRSATLLK